MRKLLNYTLFTIMLLATVTQANANSLLSDLSENQIKIDARFTGKNLLLFGARNDVGDIIVVVRGPKKNYKVRKKERILGIWLNNKQTIFEDIYSYYAVYSSRPLGEIQTGNILKQLNIGLDNIQMDYTGQTDFSELNQYRTALQSKFLNNDLYQERYNQVTFMGDTLFKTNLEFPKKIPKGVHVAEIYLISDGQIKGMQTRPIIVKKTGFEAFIYNFAHNDPLSYGILTISISLLFGWLANMIFWKV